MNRRQFTLGLSAIAATPAVPMASFANPTTVSAAALKHFNLAKLLARAHNNCSNAMLVRHLKVDAQMAAEVEQLLLNKNVITLPNLQGFSKAINPMNLNCVPKEALKAPNLTKSVTDVVEKIKEVLSEEDKNIEKDTYIETEEKIDAPVVDDVIISDEETDFT